MKKLLIIILCVLCLCGCSEAGNAAAVDNTDTNGGKTTPDNTETKPQSDEATLIDKYLEAMEEDTILEIYYLGTLNFDNSFDNIMKRAEEEFGLELVKELNERVFYGTDDDAAENVYLIIPNKGVDIALDSSNLEHTDMFNLNFKEENAAPFIYIEEDTFMNPAAVMSVTYKNKDGETETEKVYTGLDTVFRRVRTGEYENIVDMTNYDFFTSAERGMYNQGIFDKLYNDAPAVNQDLQSEYYKAYSDRELVYNDNMYMVYEIRGVNEGTKGYFYAIHYDHVTGEYKYMISRDGIKWNDSFGE